MFLNVHSYSEVTSKYSCSKESDEMHFRCGLDIHPPQHFLSDQCRTWLNVFSDFPRLVWQQKKKRWNGDSEIYCTICILSEAGQSLPDTSLSHSFTCFHSEKDRGSEVASFVKKKIYAVLSDVVIMHWRALLHRPGVATALKALHKLQHRPDQTSLPYSAMRVAGDKLEWLQSVQQIKWLHLVLWGLWCWHY